MAERRKARRRGRGEGSLYEREDGRYAAALTVGRGKRKWFYGKTRKEALDKLNAAKRLQAEGRLLTGPDQLLSDYLDKWLTEVTALHGLRPTTERAYTHQIGCAKRHLEGVRLSALTTEALETAYTKLLADGLSPHSVALVHGTLKRALSRAVAHDLLTKNPAAAAKAPRWQRRRMQVLDSGQLQTLLRETKGTRWHGLWTILGTCGLRISEALALRWTDFDGAALHISRQLGRQGGEWTFVPPKTEAAVRRVPLTQAAIRALSEHRVLQLEERLQAGALWEDRDLVFANVSGEPLHQSSVGEQLRGKLAALGLPRLRVHDLRHTAATLHLERGAQVHLVSAWLGHASISHTLTLYAHVTTYMEDAALAEMDKLLEAT